MPETHDELDEAGAAWAAGEAATLDAFLSPTYTHSDVFGTSRIAPGTRAP